MQPRYPIYIISKGRYAYNHTSKILDWMGVPHFLVVEPQERDFYAAAVSPFATLLVLDMIYKDAYDSCDPAGDGRGISKGSGPARNFVWDHAVSQGVNWHWILDDNIIYFHRLNYNHKNLAGDGTIFRCMEDFVERYENIALAGPNYEGFIPQKKEKPPITFNTRIYSCILIRNDLPYRWRSRYNEDVDLSLRVLKDGWCTILFNAFLQKKPRTQRVKGGNTEAFYAEYGTLPKSRVLVNLHPDVARVTWRFGRWHHYVDYRPFKYNLLQRKSDIAIPGGIDNYGMVFQEKVDNDWITSREKRLASSR